LFQQLKDNYAKWVIGIGGFLLLLELFVFNPGLIFSLLVSVGMIYFAKKSLKGLMGKILFWLGLLILIVSILNMITVKFLLFSVLVYFFIQLIHNKKNTTVIEPVIKDKIMNSEEEASYIKKKPLFTNALLNRNSTPNHVYEWDDINIQCGVNDTKIDLSYTVLPEGETVITIRNIIGNVKLFIPYDMEVNINHSLLFGSYRILGETEENAFNKNISIKTSEYHQANTRVKILTSFVLGSLEVKRV